MEAIAKFDFVATADDELSFKKNDLIIILNVEDDEHWWEAERDGHQGLVPSNYIVPRFNQWYRSGMSRVESEQFLKDKPAGGFIVRPSESTGEGYSLSVKYPQGNVHHFKILRDECHKYYVWVVKFRSINQLISYYKVNTLSKTQDIRLTEIFPQYVRAVFDFKGAEPDELSFRVGDIILLSDSDDLDWWFGSIGNRVGQFPASYVVQCGATIANS